MLDIKLLRENPKIVRESEKKRGHSTKTIDEVLNLDKKWLNFKQEVEKLKHKRNIVSLEINKLKKEGKSTTIKIKEMQTVAKKIHDLDSKTNETLKQRKEILSQIGNIIHKSVPIGKEEKDNKVIRKWGKPTKLSFKLVKHFFI